MRHFEHDVYNKVQTIFGYVDGHVGKLKEFAKNSNSRCHLRQQNIVTLATLSTHTII